MEENKLIIYESKIRKEYHDGEWYFSIVDVIEVLTDSPQPTSYWNKVKKQLKKESELLPFWQKLKFIAHDGKMRPTDCANTEGVLRVIMSIPSPKAEPFKLWLSQVGKERLDEAENPELAIERLTRIYQAKGYEDSWIATRLKAIGIRKELTEEWNRRGVSDSKEFSLLTATIAKETFGMTPSEHAKYKGLENESLRDHMTNFELIFSMLGEEATRAIAIRDDAQGLYENQEAAIKGGKEAGKARKRFEKSVGVKVISKENFKQKTLE